MDFLIEETEFYSEFDMQNMTLDVKHSWGSLCCWCEALLRQLVLLYKLYNFLCFQSWLLGILAIISS